MEMTFAAIIGLVLGLFFTYYDKKSGTNLYKKWYNISNKNKIDPDLEIGFVTNQLFGQKLTVALILTGIFYLISFLVFGVNPVKSLFYMIAFFLGLMVAFYTANLILSMFSKKVSGAIDYIEKVEKGGIDLGEEAKKSSNKVKDKVKETVTGNEKIVVEEKPEPIPEPAKEADPKEDSNWRDGVKKFMDK